jgi:hypothetical protein
MCKTIKRLFCGAESRKSKDSNGSTAGPRELNLDAVDLPDETDPRGIRRPEAVGLGQ